MTRYPIAADRVSGGAVHLRCRGCGELIQLDERDASGGVSDSLPSGEGVLASGAPRSPPGAATAPSRGPPRLPRAPPLIPRAPRVPSIGGKPGGTAVGQGELDPGAGALAGAFCREAEGRAAPASAALATPANDWFVGMGAVAVGPMTLGEVRTRVARGAVGPESLVWREGFEDWRPLGSYPELLALIETFDPDRQDLVAASPLSPPGSIPAPGEAGSPFGAAALGGRALPGEIPGVSRGPATGVLLAAATVGSLLLGLGVGFLVFGRRPTTETTERIRSAAPAPADSIAGVGDRLGGERGASAASVAFVPSPAGSHAPAATTGWRGAPMRGLETLAGPRPPAGPASAPIPTDSPLAPARPLEAGAVQRTVSGQTGAVRRGCWQPALDRRQEGAPSTARVVLTIDVLPSGRVSRVSATPDPPGYPGLSACIAGRVRGWKFPPSSGATVQVPFVFAAQ